MQKLAQCLDWEADLPEAEVLEAKRLVEEARLLACVHAQNAMKGVCPPPVFVWEQRCALCIENSAELDSRASPHRTSRSAGAKKWVQRFRQRWGLVRCRLPAKELLPADAMQAKVLLHGVKI